jgi:hypothetical protein
VRHETCALLDLLLECRHIRAVQPVVERLVRRRFGREQKMSADSSNGLAGRLARGEIIAQIDRLQMGILRPVRGEPARGRTGLAILLFRSVLRRDELRLQRQCAVVSGGDEGGRNHLVEMLGLTVGALAGRAVGTGKLLRAEIFGAVERNQDVAAEPLERRQSAAGFQGRERAREHRKKLLWRDRIEQRADAIVGRNPRHLEQRLAVRGAAPASQRRLLRQERRALHEERRECRHADVGHLIHGVLALPLIGKGRAQALEGGDELLEHHATLESKNAIRIDESHRHTRQPRDRSHIENCC